ncbi:TPA: ECF transporter S component [Streptococcus agalactiae]|uniref:ECF transporter S component n=1 Tax=Streptococcus agalactiae TaxID=1311 RepID=UPI000332E9FB|nr:ECF transporter S component [Streptococcus agalactiae]CCW41666.1 Substrate-specific component STY3230 of queuosine-regulated ECF transporter [Streptococcus agalactiae ILRI112]MCP9190907.1 ECF transporter S component [Streptococcus agalactiae]OTG46990.1 ECF transporter S component [Streptococcus agalactiae]OTG48350.1 ECF transporter S component [Streptococcus agalactiae]OTG53644.1 ECF transporter S component [Streptococcus agalactiae]
MTKSPARLISFISIAIAINLVGANLALFLRLPIYLDTIGTLLIAVILGPWYAASTAFLSALINWMTTDIFSLYYSPVAIVVAIITGILIKRNCKPSSLLWKSLIISLPGTIIASVITVILFKGITSSGSSIIAQFLHGIGLDMTSSLILVQVGTDYIDRLISLILVFSTITLLIKHSPNLINQRF